MKTTCEAKAISKTSIAWPKKPGCESHTKQGAMKSGGGCASLLKLVRMVLVVFVDAHDVGSHRPPTIAAIPFGSYESS